MLLSNDRAQARRVSAANEGTRQTQCMPGVACSALLAHPALLLTFQTVFVPAAAGFYAPVGENFTRGEGRHEQYRGKSQEHQ